MGKIRETKNTRLKQKFVGESGELHHKLLYAVEYEMKGVPGFHHAEYRLSYNGVFLAFENKQWEIAFIFKTLDLDDAWKKFEGWRNAQSSKA